MKKKKIKILHVAQAAGGVDRYIRMLLKYLDKEKFENILVCSQDFREKDYKNLVDFFEQVKMDRAIGSNDLKAIGEVRRLIKRYNPDIVYAHSSKAGAIARVADIGLKNHCLYNPHGWAFNMRCSAKKEAMYTAIEKIAAPFCDKIICISDAEKQSALQHGKHQAGNYTKHQYPLKGKVYCGYCQKLMKYRVLKKLGPSFNCRFSATAVDSPCKRIPISEELLEEIVRNALTAQIKQAEHILEILRERERKALICFSALERQEEKLSVEKAEFVKQRVALYEQYADGNMSKEEFIRQRAAYRVQEDERMAQIQRLRTEKNRIFQPVKKDADNLQTVVSAVEESGDVIFRLMNWNRECRYKVLGRVANSDQGLCMLFDLEEAIMFTPKPQEYTDPLTGEMKKKQMKFFPDAYKNRVGKSYNDYIADHQMNMFEDFIGYQGSTVLDEPEREAGTTSIPIPQREESENIPLPDLPGQLENVQQSGNEIAERGMPT